MADTYEAYSTRIGEYRDKLQYVEGAVGVVAAIGGKIVSADLFDLPATCQKLWSRMLSGLVLDALEAGVAETSAGVDDVERTVSALGSLAWEPVATVGLGQEYRVSGDQLVAFALFCDGTPVHVSVVAR